MSLSSQIKGKVLIFKHWFLEASLGKKVILVLLILGIGWFGLRPVIVGNKQSQVQYQTATVEKGTLITSVTSSGLISSVSSASITTSATGVVSDVYVQNGDAVNQGNTIAILTLDSSSLQKQTAAWASYLSAQNALNTAKSRMNSLQSALFTANQKFVNGAGTKDPDTDDPTYIIQRADWLQAESDYNNQKGVIAAAEAAFSSAWLSYSQTSATVTAPISGTVNSLSLTPGLAISGSSNGASSSDTSTSQAFGSITLLDGTPQASVNVSEIDVTKLEVGQKATLTLDAFPDKTFTGRVAAINTNGTTSSGVTSYPVTITFDTSVAKLYPNMAVSATIITAIKDSVLLVPSSAVQTINGETTIRVMQKGQIASIPVEIGASNDSQTEIIAGVNAGDIVVTGQIGGNTAGVSSGQQGVSPFGGTGFGGGRGFGGGTGGQNRVFIQGR